jgi:glucose-6-phosphate isomerase
MIIDVNFSGKDDLSAKYFETSFLQDKFDKFKQTINDKSIGFFHVTDNDDLIKECQEILKIFKHKKTFIHLGIGGSSLGPEMLITALKKNNNKFIFINNIDPDEIFTQLENIDIEDSLFYFCSKSGATAETMAGLSIMTQLLSAQGIGQDQLKNYFVFATDPSQSQLLQLGKELDINCLTIPSNIGGRFTVLTPVGFLPAIFADIKIDHLNKGANAAKKLILNKEMNNNILLQSASFLYALKVEKDISQTVFMPYSSKLRNLSFWFVQLWAESLGKKYNTRGQIIHTGLTPIPAYGATDQHSQVQLFMEGPYDKSILLLEIEKFDHDYLLNNPYSQDSLSKLKKYSLGQLCKAELKGTLKALKENHRPYIHYTIPVINEESLGSFILFCESLTALMGIYLEINPFDQPGVELGKKYAYEWLEDSN